MKAPDKKPERNHVYLYTVLIKRTKEEKQVEAYNIHNVAGKLGLELDDIHYITKVIL
jgi:hypothetical protein